MAPDTSQRSAEPPFFVVGAQRSGSTLIRLMLDHHPQIAVPHEFDYLIEAVTPAGPWPVRAQLERAFGQSGSFRRSGLRADLSLPFPELSESLLRQHQGDKPLVGMVVHAHFERILRLWPEARFIHLLRDPRDVARSVVGMGWAGNVWFGAARWAEAESSWERLRSALSAERFAEVRYEELITDPESALAPVCALLGVRYTDQMLSYAQRTTYAAPDAALASRWRTQLSPHEVRLIETRVGPLLTARGYESSWQRTLSVGRFRHAALTADDWLGRLRFRTARFGIGLVAADILARKLGIASWERRLQARIHAVADRYVR